jgi:hypothetical protein
MNFNNNNEWKSYVTDIVILSIIMIAYTATMGMAMEM